MWIGFSLIGAATDRHRRHTLAHRHARHAGEVGQEFFEPQFQIETVTQDQIGLAGFQNVARGWLVIVNFRARLGDALHLGRIARHIARHVGDDGEGGDHRGFLLRLFLSDGGGGKKKRKSENGMPDFLEIHVCHRMLLRLIRNTICYKITFVNAIANHSQFSRIRKCPKMVRFCGCNAGRVKLFSMRKRHYRKARDSVVQGFIPRVFLIFRATFRGEGDKAGYLMSGCCG
ncbi:hypothetical protein AGR13a_Lc110430 [Agrobacterium genomosp. 13 str. CFBP 6927]|uniref:Uncharacterized protein n=1 Tax=Agrobacterium genomosp. 13 str. CFBP 6927 TaxID=1183428 RepID=A0ABM9VK85_9HYPH|nr:hypothetical protein AGR13a_Lc110430 [Agrobacterium genomosp. 13 str. CFBP 6927]